MVGCMYRFTKCCCLGHQKVSSRIARCYVIESGDSSLSPPTWIFSRCTPLLPLPVNLDEQVLVVIPPSVWRHAQQRSRSSSEAWSVPPLSTISCFLSSCCIYIEIHQLEGSTSLSSVSSHSDRTRKLGNSETRKPSATACVMLWATRATIACRHASSIETFSEAIMKRGMAVAVV